MTRGYWIILEGPGGELDRKFCKLTDNLKLAVLGAITEWEIDAGDTIRIEEGESETD